MGADETQPETILSVLIGRLAGPMHRESGSPTPCGMSEHAYDNRQMGWRWNVRLCPVSRVWLHSPSPQVLQTVQDRFGSADDLDTWNAVVRAAKQHADRDGTVRLPSICGP